MTIRDYSLTVFALIPAIFIRDAANTALSDAANAVRQYLGDDAEMIVNDNGDLVLMNDTQKVRLNINNPHGYEPHFHIEQLDANGDWVDAGNQHMYFFKGE